MRPAPSMSTSTAKPIRRRCNSRTRVEIGKAFEFLLDQLPVGERIDEQAAVGVGGNDHMAGAALDQRITMSGRHRQPALNIQI